jgi:hypothetical protein
LVTGLLTMMGQHDRSEALFYYFRLEDQVPENHLLRLNREALITVVHYTKGNFNGTPNVTSTITTP